MSVNFLSDDWKYAVTEAEKIISNNRSILENPDTTYKQKLVAIGQIAAAKRIINLPHVTQVPQRGNQ